MNDNYFPTNLKYLRTKRGLEQKDISDMLGLKSPTSVTNWEKGSNMAKTGHLNDLATYFGVSLHELVNVDLTKQRDNGTQSIEEIIKIPVLGSIACGDPITAEENIEEYRDRPTNNLPSGELFYLKAKGDSMEPLIPNDSYVLVREQADVENGEIAAVLVNGETEATLKKVRKLNDVILLEAVNDNYAPYIIDDKNPARILGKAVEVSFEL
jgi:repressor LexA